jgi:hypothetical protein
MPQAINFDSIVPETIDITKAGRTWKLRDDVPMVILLRTFGLQALNEQIQTQLAAFNPALSNATEAQQLLDRVFGELTAATLAIFGDIVRHTYPEHTNEELAEAFTFEEQSQVVTVFFTHRLGSSNEPSPATPSDSPTLPELPPEAEMGEADGITEMAAALRNGTAAQHTRRGTTRRS